MNEDEKRDLEGRARANKRRERWDKARSEVHLRLRARKYAVATVREWEAQDSSTPTVLPPDVLLLADQYIKIGNRTFEMREYIDQLERELAERDDEQD